MKRSNRLILLIGVFLAIVAFVGIVLLSNQRPDPGTATPTILKTVITTVEIPLGTEVTPDMLTTQDIAVEGRNTGAFADTTQVVGQTVRREVAAGAQITESDFTPITSAADLAELLPPGNRAMAVQVDQVSGVGTLIQAGDRVDMVVGFAGDRFPVISVDPSAPGGGGVTSVSGLNNTSVKLLLQGMQVLSTLLPPPTAPAEGQAPAEGEEAPPATLTGQQQIVLLSVSAQQAEVIKFAQLDGTISLVLRAPGDFLDDQGQPLEPLGTPTSGVTLKVLVDEYDVLVPQLVESLLPALEGR